MEMGTSTPLRTKQLGLEDAASSMFMPAVLPSLIRRVQVPPIKCQGIKTKLAPFILSSIRWPGTGRWIEPFVGSGVVALNLLPARALLTDVNPHVIRFYQDIADSVVTPGRVREFLEQEGGRLFERGAEYYYEVRRRFNAAPSSFDFLFLNRSCFNGLIRFNGAGKFNVPFGKKPDRFRQAYITKIVNQVDRLADAIRGRDWTFKHADWREVVSEAAGDDFVYADPPYVGRHTDYYNQWSVEEAEQLLSELRKLQCGFALSSWKENRHRRNPYLPEEDADLVIRTTRHFYHVGSREELRNPIEEALVIKRGFACSVPEAAQIA